MPDSIEENDLSVAGDDSELAAQVAEQIEINRIKITRLQSLLVIERIHAVVGGVCTFLLALVLLFAVISTFYPSITRVDINSELLVAFIIPSFILGAYGLLTFFTSSIARVHELKHLQNWNLKIIEAAHRALDGASGKNPAGERNSSSHAFG